MNVFYIKMLSLRIMHVILIISVNFTYLITVVIIVVPPYKTNTWILTQIPWSKIHITQPLSKMFDIYDMIYIYHTCILGPNDTRNIC